jgi:hypothetical protein
VGFTVHDKARYLASVRRRQIRSNTSMAPIWGTSVALNLFDALPEDKQARIYQILFRGVLVSCVGRGVARRWRLLEYTPAFGAEPSIVTNSAAVRLPNPAEVRTGKCAAGSVVKEDSQRQVVTTCPT